MCDILSNYGYLFAKFDAMCVSNLSNRRENI